MATIDLNAVIPSKKVFFYFVWSPNETRLSIGPKDVEGGKLVTSEGEISQKKFQIGEDGKVVQVGDEGVEVMALSVYENGKQTLKPSALDNWKNSIFSVEKLINGTSIEGYIFESIVANQALSILITGFETYSKARFRELEQEGIKPELEELVAKLFSLKKQEAIKAAVVKDNLVLIEYLVNGKKGKGLINFQDYALCKKVFKITYDIDFDELNIASKDVSKIKKVFNFRHKIIHVSPLSGMLNQDEVPSEDPIFSNKKFVVGTLAIFDDFIKKLHATTLRLKRND